MRRPALCAAAFGVSSALRPAVLPHARRRALLRAVDDEAQTAYNPATEILDETKKKGFLAPAPSPTAAAGARRAAEYLANPRFEVLSAAITLLSCAAYAFNTLNDLPETVATALPVLEKERPRSSWPSTWPDFIRGASTRGADQCIDRALVA